jgi:hypothetical protein
MAEWCSHFMAERVPSYQQLCSMKRLVEPMNFRNFSVRSKKCVYPKCPIAESTGNIASLRLPGGYLICRFQHNAAKFRMFSS